MPHDDLLAGQTLKAANLSLPAASVFRAANQTNIANNVFTRVDFDSILYDHGDNFVIATSRFVCPRDGIVAVNSTVVFDVSSATAAGESSALDVFKNGADYKRGSQLPFTAASAHHGIPLGGVDVDVVTNDFLEIHVFQNTGGTRTLLGDAALIWATFRYVSFDPDPT